MSHIAEITDTGKTEGRNLRYLLEKGIDVNDLIAVRAIDNGYLNNERDNFYAGPFRPTIHFALNHFVQNGIYGDWDGTDTVIFTAFKDLVKNNQNNFVGGSTTDVFCTGYCRLPKIEIERRKEWEDGEAFRERVERTIQKMGYKVLPSGDWAWGGDWDATRQFDRLLGSLGPYEFAHHCNTIFSKTDKLIINSLRNYEGGDDFEPPDPNHASSKYILRRYLQDIAYGLGADSLLETDKSGRILYPDTADERAEFLCRVGYHSGKAPESFREWFIRNIQGNDVLELKRNKKVKMNLDFFQRAWVDFFWGSAELEEKYLRGRAEREKERYKRSEEEMDLQSVKAYEISADIVAKYPTRFAGHLNSWLNYWRAQNMDKKRLGRTHFGSSQEPTLEEPSWGPKAL